jgi:hypothetical protein
MVANRLVPFVVLALAACGQSEVNPPTSPAQPINTPEAQAPPPTPPPGVGSVMPGSGPQTFVGRWAARTAWCGNGHGDQQPIEITTTRLEGYENRCDIAALIQVADGYEASLSCAGEGQTANERVRMSVQGDVMRLTWLNRNDAVVRLTRCPSPTAPTEPAPAP